MSDVQLVANGQAPNFASYTRRDSLPPQVSNLLRAPHGFPVRQDLIVPGEDSVPNALFNLAPFLQLLPPTLGFFKLSFLGLQHHLFILLSVLLSFFSWLGWEICRSVLEDERRGGQWLKIQVLPHILLGRGWPARSSSLVFIFLEQRHQVSLGPTSFVSSKKELLVAEFIVRVSALQVFSAVQKESLGQKKGSKSSLLW